MRYYEILNENTSELTSQIKRECSEILSIYQSLPGRYSFRGIRIDKDYFKSKIPAKNDDIYMVVDKGNDDTLQSKEDYHLITQIFTELGLKANRENSIFCAGPGIASNWGNVFLIFPTNGFKYTWFKNQQGGYVIFDLLNIFEELPKNIDQKQKHDLVKKGIQDLQPMTTNMTGSFKTQDEVLITGSAYWLVSLKWSKNNLSFFDELGLIPPAGYHNINSEFEVL